MSLNQEQQAQLERDLASLTEDEIKRRLAHGIWGAEKRRLVELHLEKLEMERRDRFNAKDRRLQWWIFWVAVASLAVGIVGILVPLWR